MKAPVPPNCPDRHFLPCIVDGASIGRCLNMPALHDRNLIQGEKGERGGKEKERREEGRRRKGERREGGDT
jgi:hypothetical protein